MEWSDRIPVYARNFRRRIEQSIRFWSDQGNLRHGGPAGQRRNRICTPLPGDRWCLAIHRLHFIESGTPVLATLSPASTTVLATTQTFTWSNGAGPSDYRLLLGTTGVGSNNLYGSGITTATCATVTLPANGLIVYARFYQEVDGVWQYTDSTFKESGTPVLATLIPAAPAVLATTQTFTWSNGAGPSDYWFCSEQPA